MKEIKLGVLEQGIEDDNWRTVERSRKGLGSCQRSSCLCMVRPRASVAVLGKNLTSESRGVRVCGNVCGCVPVCSLRHPVC